MYFDTQIASLCHRAELVGRRRRIALNVWSDSAKLGLTRNRLMTMTVLIHNESFHFTNKERIQVYSKYCDDKGKELVGVH